MLHFRRLPARLLQSAKQRVETRARLARHGDDRRAGIGRSFQKAGNLAGNELEPVFIDQVRLRERHDARADAERLQHREMLDGLGHYAVVGRDDEQRHVDARRTRNHLPHELLVTGHIHDSHRAPVRQLDAREPELNRDAALLLLREPVGVGSRERFHEGRLAVVDVPRRSQDEVRVNPMHSKLPFCSR